MKTKYATTATLRKAGKYEPGPYAIHSGMAVMSGLGLEDLRALRDAADAILADEKNKSASKDAPEELEALLSWSATDFEK